MEHHLTQHSLVVRRDHPQSSAAIDYFLRTGALVPMLPGVHRWAGVEETFELRAEAAQKWQVNGVLFGGTAARLSWWPNSNEEKVRLICPTSRPSVPWLRTSRQKVPPELLITQGEWRLVNTELSILQMCAAGDGAAIAEGLREGATTLQALWAAWKLLPRSTQGKARMGRLLEEARDEPWSTLELDAHRKLREARITGWRTNVKLDVNGETYFGDVLFHSERLILELDGRQYHTHADLDDNNQRRNALEAAGWRVFNFSGATLAEMVPTILPVLKQARSAWRKDRLPLLPLAESGNDDESADGGEWHVA